MMCRTLQGHAHWVNTMALSTDYAARIGAWDPAAKKGAPVSNEFTLILQLQGAQVYNIPEGRAHYHGNSSKLNGFLRPIRGGFVQYSPYLYQMRLLPNKLLRKNNPELKITQNSKSYFRLLCRFHDFCTRMFTVCRNYLPAYATVSPQKKITN